MADISNNAEAEFRAARDAEAAGRLVLLEKRLLKDTRFDILRLLMPNALLVPLIAYVALAPFFGGAELRDNLISVYGAVGATMIALGFGLYGLTVVQARRNRILELEAERLSHRAMRAANAIGAITPD